MDASFDFDKNVTLVKYDAFVMVSSLLGAGIILLIIAVIVLFVWITILHKRLRQQDTFKTFKIRRPHLIKPEENAHRSNSPKLQMDETQNNCHTNPLMFRQSNPDFTNVQISRNSDGYGYGQSATNLQPQPPVNYFDRNSRFY